MNKIKIKIYIFDPNRAGVIGEAIKVKEYEIKTMEDTVNLAGWHCVPCICIIQEQRKSEAGERELFLKELEKRCDAIVSGYTNIIDPSLMLDFICKYNKLLEEYVITQNLALLTSRARLNLLKDDDDEDLGGEINGTKK